MSTKKEYAVSGIDTLEKLKVASNILEPEFDANDYDQEEIDDEIKKGNVLFHPDQIGEYYFWDNYNQETSKCIPITYEELKKLSPKNMLKANTLSNLGEQVSFFDELGEHACSDEKFITKSNLNGICTSGSKTSIEDFIVLPKNHLGVHCAVQALEALRLLQKNNCTDTLNSFKKLLEEPCDD